MTIDLNQGDYSINVTWKEGTTEEEKVATAEFVKAMFEELQTGALPECMTGIDIKRI